MSALHEYLQAKRELVDGALDRYLPPATHEPRSIHECMRYSSLGGKRLRPVVALAVAEMLACPAERVLPTCAAIELIHTHSLILDDLPCMDDDDYRRGRLASHRQFGEGVALLAADALLNLAIALLGANHRVAGVRPEIALDIIKEVGDAVGTNGVIGGQMADLAYRGPAGDGVELERIHLGKTARLFRLSARAAALIAGAGERELACLGLYGERLGLAFQIVDDVLDHQDGREQVWQRGKSRPSYAAAHGIEAARATALRTTDAALEALCGFGKEAEMLRLLAGHNLERGPT